MSENRNAEDLEAGERSTPVPVGGAVKGLAGIPKYMYAPLGDFMSACRGRAYTDTANGKPYAEACGLFLFEATNWYPGKGWAGRIVFKEMSNVCERESGFVMHNGEAQDAMAAALDTRHEVATRVCAEQGWDDDTPWTVPFFEHAGELFDNDHKDMSVSMEVRGNLISEMFREEQLDLAAGWEKNRLRFLRTGARLEATDHLSCSKDDTDTSRLSALEWLMIRGTSVLAGIGHSHPSGNGDISPEDFLHTSVVETWQKIFQFRVTGSGQKAEAYLEKSANVGCWIYALPERVGVSDGSFRFYGHSTLTRYDKRGKKGTWTGPF